MAVFQYTGGTTRHPKAAMLTHRNLVANSNQVRAWLTDTVEGEETVMAILPFFHAYGGTLCLYLAVQLAARIVLVPRFEVKDVMEMVEQYEPTILPGVPTLYNALNSAAENNPGRQQALSSIRCCVSGGAPLRPTCKNSKKSPAAGSSRATGSPKPRRSHTSIHSTAGPATALSVCRFPTPKSGSSIPIPETLSVRASVANCSFAVPGDEGYWQRPEDTASVLDVTAGSIPVISLRWTKTGSSGSSIASRTSSSPAARTFIPGRLKRSGSHPKIHEVAVAGVNHQVGGEIAKAYIVLREGKQ